MLTYFCNLDPPEPRLYTRKMGFTGEILFFSILSETHIVVLVLTALIGSTMYVFNKNKKKILYPKIVKFDCHKSTLHFIGMLTLFIRKSIA